LGQIATQGGGGQMAGGQPQVGRPVRGGLSQQNANWGASNPNSPFLPNDAPNPSYNGPPVVGRGGFGGGYNPNEGLPDRFGGGFNPDDSNRPRGGFNPDGSPMGTGGQGRPFVGAINPYTTFPEPKLTSPMEPDNRRPNPNTVNYMPMTQLLHKKLQ
jgi:hypothetical protein